jgi:hypothetical protein
MKKKILIILLAVISALMIAPLLCGTAGAEYRLPDELKPSNVPFDIDIGQTKDPGVTQIQYILQVIAGALLYVAAPLAVLMIAMIGFNLALGSGSAEKIEAAKKTLTWAVLGLVIIILSYALVKFVLAFGFQIFG